MGMDWLGLVGEAVSAPLWRPLVFSDPFSLWSLAGAFTTAAVVFVLRRGRRQAIGRVRSRIRLRALIRFLFPARIWRHPSTALDIKFYIFTSVIMIMGLGALPLTASAWSQATTSGLTALFGAGSSPVGAVTAVTLATLVGVLVFDFSYYLTHRLLHDIPALWEFHKVHHSAEVMTPLTEWRQHPVEVFAFPLMAGLVTGVAQGVMVYGLGPQANALSIGGVNLVMAAYIGTVLHLRHSHVWLPVKGWMGAVIQSPAHHQIHHSTRPEHAGKNLGFSLSVFDALFGTLCVPQKRMALTFGLPPQDDPSHTLVGSLSQPVIKAWKPIRPQTPPRPASV